MFELKKSKKDRLNEVLRHPVAGVIACVMPHKHHASCTSPRGQHLESWKKIRVFQSDNWFSLFGFKLKGFRFNLLKSGIVYSFIMILTLS